MSEEFKLEIVNPEKSFLSKEDVTEVLVPAYEGDMGILKDHISIISFLKPGILKVFSKSGEDKYYVEDGIIEFKDNTLFAIYSSFASVEKQENMKNLFEDGIGWGDAKQKVFEDLNQMLLPIREKFMELSNNKKFIEEILKSGAEKVRLHTVPALKEVKKLVGISRL